MAEKVANMLPTCRHIFVSGFANIHPFLLRVPEVHTKDFSVSSDMRVTVGVAKRYLVSDNAKKIKVVTR